MTKNLPPQSKGGRSVQDRHILRQIVSDLYYSDSALTWAEISRRTGLCERTIKSIYNEFGFTKDHRVLRGSEHGSWKGGRHVNHEGYINVIMYDDHPYISMRKRDGYVFEHRLVVAEALGRPLTPNETVHHKDGNRQNNHIDNLQLMHKGHERGIKLRCRDCGSCDIATETL